MDRRVVVGVAVVVVGVLAGCGGPAPEPVGLSASPTVEAPTPTPTPTPSSSPLPDETGVVVDLSDPELGIVFEDVPDLSGDEADVYTTMALYEREYWRSMVTNEVSPVIYTLVSAEVLAVFESFTEENTTEQAQIGGEFHVTIADVSVDGDIASGTACDSYAEVTFTDHDGPDTPEEAGFGEPRLKEVALRRAPTEGQWTIMAVERIGTC